MSPHSVSSHDQDAPPSGSDPGALPAGPHEVTGLGPEFRSTAQDHQTLRDAMGEERYEDRHYNHLPIHEGPVERNIYAPSEDLPGVLARYERGAVVTEETFISTSPDPDGLQSGNVRFTIESRTGREILPGLSGDPGEREILF